MENLFSQIFEEKTYVGFYPTDASPTAYAECEVIVKQDEILMRISQQEDIASVQPIGTIAELQELAQTISTEEA